MKYEPDSECKKLLSNPSPERAPNLNKIVNFLVENIATLLKSSLDCTLNQHASFYHQLGSILKVCIGKDEEEFNSVCKQIDEKGKKHNYSNLTQGMVKALGNIRNLLNGNVKTIFPEILNLNKNEHEVIIAHVNDIERRLQTEKDRILVKLLHQKNIEDGKAMKRGERLKLEEREAYKIVKAINQGVFK